MANVFNVANYVLSKTGEITTMKLEKLVYYCQAWSLAWDGKPLFQEDFQAWSNGPVCPELFRQHRGHFVVEENFFSEIENCEFSPDQLETMDIVINDYGDKTSQWLSELTHKERPWKETRGDLALGVPSSKVIKKDLMQEYYGGLMDCE